MSTVKANNHQVGQSVTATNNFTLYQPATPDGTVRLGVGNAGATTSDVITATNAGNVTIAGTLTAAAVVGGLPGGQGQAFTSSGTFTIPTGITAIKMTIVGGGGNGGATTGANVAASGGGGGGAAIKFLTGLTPGNTLTVTVGAAGGTSSVASGTQSITTVSATGGANGTTTTSSQGAGGSGGVGSNGDLNIGGGGGGNSHYFTISCNLYGFPGAGGASILGGGGAGVATGAGNAGRVYGGGGSGAMYGFFAAGGAGAAGVVLIEW
jgi:hypothetical protein